MKAPTMLLLILIGIYGESSATTPPHSPTYCGPFICVEIPRSFGVNRIMVSSNPGDGEVRSELEIAGRFGKATLLAEQVSTVSECNQSSSLSLSHAGNGAMEAVGIVEGPDKSFCLRVSVVVVSKSNDNDSSGLTPITAIWAVDGLPTTFWKKGYALRLGPQLEVIKGGGGN